MDSQRSKSQIDAQKRLSRQTLLSAGTAIAAFLVCYLLLPNGLTAQVVRLPKVKNAPMPMSMPILEVKLQSQVQPEIPQPLLPSKQSLTIEELQQMALATNPTLVQAAGRVRAMQGTKCQVGLRPNPNIGWLAEEMGNGGQAGRQGIGFSQEIVTGDKLCLSRATATRAVWAAEAQFRAQQRRVENDVRMAAITILSLQDQLAMFEELVEISSRTVKNVEQLFQAKEVSRSDVLKAQIEANRTSLALKKARRNHQAAWKKLVGILGRPDLPQKKIEGSLEKNFPILTWEDSLQRLLAKSPLLDEVDAKIDQARWELRRQCAERKSNIDVGAAVAYNDDSEYTEATLEVIVPLKVYDRNQGNIMRARAELMIAQQERDRICLVLHNQLVEAFREYKVAQLEVTAYRETLLPKAKESLELTRQSFQEQELSHLEFFLAQHTYFSTRIDYVDSLELLWTASAKIEGLLLSDGLDTQQ